MFTLNIFIFFDIYFKENVYGRLVYLWKSLSRYMLLTNNKKVNNVIHAIDDNSKQKYNSKDNFNVLTGIVQYDNYCIDNTIMIIINDINYIYYYDYNRNDYD